MAACCPQEDVRALEPASLPSHPYPSPSATFTIVSLPAVPFAPSSPDCLLIFH